MSKKIQIINLNCGNINSVENMFNFFERFENSAKVLEFWSSLGGPHSATYWQQALGSYSWNAFVWCFSVFFAFSNPRRVRGFWPSLGGTNCARCRCVNENSMFAFLSVLKTWRRYVKLSRAESTDIDRLALYTLTPDRPPLVACTGNLIM